MIKVIIFDLGGVYFTDGTTIALKKIKKVANTNEKRIEEIFRESPGKEGMQYRLGKIKEKEFWMIAKRDLHLNEELLKKIRKIWITSYRVKKPIEKLVENLRRKYIVVAYSNTIPERIRYFNKRFKLNKKFDFYFYSFNLGFKKTDQRAYKKILSELKVRPNECVFIEDKEKHLIVPKKLGIKTILFKDAKQLKVDLTKLDAV